MKAQLQTGVLLMAYGTPRHPSDIEAYYTDIRRGRPPSPEQLANLVARYQAIGGTSPLTARTEAQRIALQQALDASASGRYCVQLGMKHAEPTIEESVAALAERGCTRTIALVLAPHYSAMSVGQYIDRARQAAAPLGVEVVAIESWALLPELVQFSANQVRAQLAQLPPNAKVVFTAHSLPTRVVDAGDPYVNQVRATAHAVAQSAGLNAWNRWATAWQSAGRTPEPWLGPDILTVIDDLAAADTHGGAQRGLLVCAVGFVADHLELLYDLDIEAAARAKDHDIAFARTECVNDDSTVIGALAELIIATDSSHVGAN